MPVKPFKKVVSIFVLIAFLFTNSIYAAPDSKSIFKNKKVNYQKLSTDHEKQLEKKKTVFQGGDNRSKELKTQEKRILSTHLKDISQIHIPSEMGRIVEVYDATASADSRQPTANSRLVVHIQDLHTNPEAQLNSAGILEILLKDYNLGLVCSEGAEGEVDTSSVSSFPDAEVREKTARLFIDSGELTGEEYLSITKYPDLPIWGIENKDIYFENIAQFNKIMEFNPQSMTFIMAAKNALGELKPKIYSKELQALDQKEVEFEDNKIETQDYLKYLTGYLQKLNIPAAKYKNVTLLNETVEIEKAIDQKKIIQDSQNLLMNLQTAISAKNDRTVMDSLMARAQLFKEEKISSFSFYVYLRDLANKHLKDQIAAYPNLNEFIGYLTRVNSLDSVRLFTELAELSFEIKLNFAKNEEEKTLIQALRNIKFLEDFFNLKVSNEELNYYLNNKNSHKAAFFEAFLKPALKKYNIQAIIDYNPELIDNHLEEIEEFYDTVKKRDVALFNNATSEIEKRNVKVAAFISGGFHTESIMKLLREKGYSYIVVAPYSKTGIDEENYRYLLSGKRKPIEELLKDLNETGEEKGTKNAKNQNK